MKKDLYKCISIILILAMGILVQGCDKSNEMSNGSKIDESNVNLEEFKDIIKPINDDKEGEGEDVQYSAGDKSKESIDKLIKKNDKGLLYISEEPEGENINFEAVIQRTGSYTSGKKFPYINVYFNPDEIIENSKYDETFFNTKALIIIGLRESSGSISHSVEKVVKSDSDITVVMKKNVPNIGTADMAEWEIYIEVDKSNINENSNVDFTFINN